MPAKENTKNVDLFQELGQEGLKAFEQNKNNEVKVSDNSGLCPAPVEMGVAQLSKITFGTYKKEGKDKALAGKRYFMAVAIVKAPKEVNGIPVYGLRTQIGPEPLCETPKKSRKTLSEHIAWVMDRVRDLMGIKEGGFNKPSDLINICKALVEKKPFTKFSVWQPPADTEGQYKGKPRPPVHKWLGLTKDFHEEEEQQVQDDTPDDSEQLAEIEAANSETAITQSNVYSGHAEFSIDLDTLAVAANKGNGPATNILTDMALGLDITKEQIDKADTWQDVVKLINSKKPITSAAPTATEDEVVEVEEEDSTPKVGQTWKYKPVDPRTKQRIKGTIDIEIKEVNVEAKTVRAKNLDDNKSVYPAIKWENLIKFD